MPENLPNPDGREYQVAFGSAQVELRTPFVCASCGSQFFERHFCPSMPWGNTAPLTTFIQIPTVVVRRGF